MKIIVLGAGLVGSPMAADLAKDKTMQVSVADISEHKLAKFNNNPEIKTICQDLSDQALLSDLVSGFDMAVSAVPGFMGYQTLKTIIETRTDVVDIAFFPEDAFSLDELAHQNNVTAVVDCGVAPGMSNMLVSYADTMLEKALNAEIYVGGLPEIRTLPWEYKAVFSPVDVIEEYIRPVFYVKNGKIIEKPALSEPELIDFPVVGTLEAFNTDGLRSLIKTMDIPNMKEKTMRYPGHIEKIRLLRDNGFFSKTPMEINNQTIRPIDLAAKLLFPSWELKKGQADITIMKVRVEGQKGGHKTSYTWDLFDRYDAQTQTHSMARTTGYTATAVLRLIREGMFSRKGIIVPEFIGQDRQCMEFIMTELKKRGIIYTQTCSNNISE